MSYRLAFSENHWSHDIQVRDALVQLGGRWPTRYASVRAEFPEIDHILWDGSHFDTEAMGVDPEWGSWLTSAIEDTGMVYWDEGQPWGWAED